MNPNGSLVPTEEQKPFFFSKLIFMIGRFLVSMVLIAPIASGGLYTATGHNPTTLMKYLSVIIVLPENFTMIPELSPFPGIPIMVAGILFILMIGLYVPEKIFPLKRKIMLQIIAMSLLILAPIINYAIQDTLLGFSFGYGIVFYLGFVGIFLQMKHEMISQQLYKPSGGSYSQAAYSMVLLAPMALPFIYASISSPAEGISIMNAFESDHHAVASSFSGIIGGIIASEIISWADIGIGGPPPEPEPPVPEGQDPGPRNGDMIEVSDHRGQKMDITYDSVAGQWVTPDGYWFDPSKAEQARKNHMADQEWSRKEHEKIAAGDSTFDRKMDEMQREADAELEAMRQKSINRKKKIILEERMEIRQEESEMWQHQATREGRGLAVAEGVEKAADVAIDVLGDVTGPPGKAIKYGYVSIKNVSKGVSQANEDGTSLVGGAVSGGIDAAVDIGFDAAMNKVRTPTGKKSGSIFNAPPSLKKIGEFVPKSAGDKIFKETLVRTTVKSAVTNAAQGQIDQYGIKDNIVYPIKNLGKKAIGL